MRLYILKALFVKEVHRHLANRGGLALAFLMIVAALLLSVFNPGTGAGGTGGGSLVGGVHRCIVKFTEETDFVRRLKGSVPDDLRTHVVFRQQSPDELDRIINLEPGTGVIQIWDRRDAGRGMEFTILHPPGDAAAMGPYEKWLFRASRDVYQAIAAEQLRAVGRTEPLPAPDPGTDDLWAVRDSFRQLRDQYDRVRTVNGKEAAALPAVEITRSGLGAKALDLRSTIATGMVVFALYFACVYLLPMLNCEERERGVLLAQALSPASPAEILTAKFLFYPVLGIGLAATIAGIYKPAVLSSLFFWLSLVAVSAGFLGIGMTVATLAKTQRAAFMGSMCYLMSVSLILFICSQNGIPGIPWLAIEYHGPRVIHAAVTQEIYRPHWGHLVGTAVLAGMWMLAAGWLFRRRGWQ